MMDGTEVPEQDQPVTEKAKKVVGEAREKLTPVAEQAQAKVTELKTSAMVDQNMRDVFQIVSTVALVGILLYNRKTFKFTKRVIKNMDKNMVSTQETISALKAAGQQFTFYPGVGVYVD